jgi:hypothetical protein
MSDSIRPFWRRAVLLTLLGLLLPVQNSLVYARSLAMLTPPKSEPVMALMSVIESPAALENHGHRHSSQDVDTLTAQESSSEHHHVSDTFKPCHSDGPTSTQGHDCAKCCLIGAVAPPPCNVHSPCQVTARHALINSSDSLSGFIPDGLERPPRT